MGKILVVDDSAVVREGIKDFLGKNGLNTDTAVDGVDALNKLRGDSSVKLVITDVNMPNMDGLTLAEKIRSELNNQAVKIIVLTTENSPALKQRGKAAGVSGWIVKPFNGQHALGPIKKMVES
ncbi:MAG: response regulator [Myxococcota bacterium]|nr:response regulator [Myxococcota bacterium]